MDVLSESSSSPKPGADKPTTQRQWLGAQQTISRELAKLLKGKPNNLIPLAEKLAANVEPGTRLFHDVGQLLWESYEFVGNFDDGWLAYQKFSRPTEHLHYRYYRRVLDKPRLPGSFVCTHSYRICLKLNAPETANLRKFAIALYEEEEAATGENCAERYCRIEDAIYAALRLDTGIDFDRFRKYRPGRPLDTTDRQELKRLVPALADSLIRQLNFFRDELLIDLKLPEILDRCIREQVTACQDDYNWGNGVFWDWHEPLYKRVYDIRYGPGGDRLDLHSLYLNRHGMRAPRRFQILKRAYDECVSGIWRRAENAYRKSVGIPGVGEGWVSETRLVAQLKAAFPGEIILTQATPKWLGNFRFDAFLPAHNIAIEYQGIQHHAPVSFFGGEVAFTYGQGRDQKKRNLAAANGCRLLEVLPDYQISDVIQSVKTLIALPTAAVAPSDIKVLSEATQLAQRKAKPRPNPNKNLGAHDLRGCARHGTADLIRSLAQEVIHYSKKTSLLWIASENQDTFKAILELGVNVNLKNCGGTTVLAQLCNAKEDPNLEIVRLLLEAGASHSTYLKGGRTYIFCGAAPPIVGAAISFNVELATLLLSFGANVNVSMQGLGMTPFIAACRPDYRLQNQIRKRIDMLRWLVSHGANPKARDVLKKSAFDYLAESSYRDVDFAAFDLLMELNVPTGGPTLALSSAYSRTDDPLLKRIIDYADANRPKAARKNSR